MNRATLTKELTCNFGFTSADALKDFGYLIKDVDYLMRKVGNFYQYVSVIGYDGRMVEVVVENYVAPKNTFRPKGTPKRAELERRGFATISGQILREPAEIFNYLRNPLPPYVPSKD